MHIKRQKEIVFEWSDEVRRTYRKSFSNYFFALSNHEPWYQSLMCETLKQNQYTEQLILIAFVRAMFLLWWRPCARWHEWGVVSSNGPFCVGQIGNSEANKNCFLYQAGTSSSVSTQFDTTPTTCYWFQTISLRRPNRVTPLSHVAIEVGSINLSGSSSDRTKMHSLAEKHEGMNSNQLEGICTVDPYLYVRAASICSK